MKRLKTNIITLSILSFLMMACASFSKGAFREDMIPLAKGDLNKLTGNYSLHPIRAYTPYETAEPNNTNPDSLQHNNGYYFLLNEKFNNIFNVWKKSDAEYLLRLHLKNTDSLQVTLLENSKIMTDTTFAGKHRNGMFYIDNKSLSCHGIPYILGGCEHNKRRIGLTKKGNLLINEAVSNKGAFLLIFAAGRSYNETYEYERK